MDPRWLGGWRTQGRGSDQWLAESRELAGPLPSPTPLMHPETISQAPHMPLLSRHHCNQLRWKRSKVVLNQRATLCRSGPRPGQGCGEAGAAFREGKGRWGGEPSASLCEHAQSLAPGVDPATTQRRPGTWEDGRLPRDRNPGQGPGRDQSELSAGHSCAWEPWLQHRTPSTHQISLGRSRGSVRGGPGACSEGCGDEVGTRPES